MKKISAYVASHCKWQSLLISALQGVQQRTMRSMSHTLFCPLLKLEWADTSSWLPKSFTSMCCSRHKSCKQQAPGMGQRVQ